MDKPEAVKDAAIQRIGCPYVYGGTGKVCTPSYREARAAQYTKYASKIRKNCPILDGDAKTCKNCRWCDPETGKGKLCYDCAQLVLAAMAAAGIPLVSGANSQWEKTRFSEKGEIADLPRDKVCMVFRRESDKKMHHVGVYLGDGTVVHAKGHDYGVVRQSVEDVTLTHYGVPAGLYDNLQPTLRRGNKGAYVKAMQEALIGCGYDIAADGVFGKKTEDALKSFQRANGLTADGVCGPKTWDVLAPDTTIPDEPEVPEPAPDEPDDPVEDDTGVVTVDREELERLLGVIEDIEQTLRGWL